MSNELHGYDERRARGQVEGIYRTLREIFHIARDRHTTTSEAADRFAEERIERIGRVRLTWVPGGRGWARIWARG